MNQENVLIHSPKHKASNQQSVTIRTIDGNLLNIIDQLTCELAHRQTPNVPGDVSCWRQATGRQVT